MGVQCKIRVTHSTPNGSHSSTLLSAPCRAVPCGAYVQFCVHTVTKCSHSTCWYCTVQKRQKQEIVILCARQRAGNGCFRVARRGAPTSSAKALVRNAPVLGYARAFEAYAVEWCGGDCEAECSTVYVHFTVLRIHMKQY